MVKRWGEDDIILSYNDVVLRQSDLDILSGPYFLNDRIIEFYLSYLCSKYASEDILLLPPTIPFWIMHVPDIESLEDFLRPLNLPSRKLVIFPVNDNDDVTEANGGNHWSLLAYERDSNVFVHHDSSSAAHNQKHAKRLYNTVAPYMVNSSSGSKADYVECDSTPVQVNGYDCGVYVIAIARLICHWFESDGPKDEGLWFSSMKEQITPSAVSEMRNEIVELIRNLRASPEQDADTNTQTVVIE